MGTSFGFVASSVQSIPFFFSFLALPHSPRIKRPKRHLMMFETIIVHIIIRFNCLFTLIHTLSFTEKVQGKTPLTNQLTTFAPTTKRSEERGRKKEKKRKGKGRKIKTNKASSPSPLSPHSPHPALPAPPLPIGASSLYSLLVRRRSSRMFWRRGRTSRLRSRPFCFFLFGKKTVRVPGFRFRRGKWGRGKREGRRGKGR